MTRSMKRWLMLGAVLAIGLAIAAVIVLKARADRVTLTLVPGRSIWDAAKVIEKAFPGRGEAVLARAADEAWVASLGLPVHPRAARGDGVQSTWLEGFLYPETYFIDADADADAIIARTTGQFLRIFGDLQATYGAAFTRLQTELGLGPAEIVVLASLVEKETARRDDAAKIAGVFLNRLRRGMKLETDPTLMYRPDRVGKPPSPSERRDKTNPYNTYAYAGLPPGPICSPGRAALLAVLEAEAHDFIFFVAKRDGTGASAFAATLEEHDANIDRYLRKRAPVDSGPGGVELPAGPNAPSP